jgi:hypothetical protein
MRWSTIKSMTPFLRIQSEMRIPAHDPQSTTPEIALVAIFMMDVSANPSIQIMDAGLPRLFFEGTQCAQMSRAG